MSQAASSVGAAMDIREHRSGTIHEPIAIIGIGCRFPGSVDDPASFWNLLRDGVDAIEDFPEERAAIDNRFSGSSEVAGNVITRQGGYLRDIDRFDASFFGISPREVMQLDPQQRLLLETAWEALEDAGIPQNNLAGSSTGVYVGVWLNDFEASIYNSMHEVELHTTTGSGRYPNAGRISFAFDLRGPSLTVDTACSSSLVAVHLAVQGLRSRQTNLALAAGVNVILQPQITEAYTRAGMLAPDGRCKFGDAAADGYVRSEGCGVLVLKRLSEALADSDPIYAVIRGSAINNDGQGSGLLVKPSTEGQIAMLREAYADAGVEPAGVGYLEAHGTGTFAGDPVEIQAIGTVLGSDRPIDEPCLVGSVKANIGHTEGAAGIAGVIKAALALRHGAIPGNIHFETPNPNIPWDDIPVRIPATLTPWPATGTPRIAGVSSFGITGTNAHIVLEEAPRIDVPSREQVQTERPVVLPISARSQQALRALASAYADRLMDPEAPALTDLAFTAASRRSQLPERLAVTGDSHQALAQRLEAFATGQPSAGLACGTAPEQAPRLVFVFPGQGGQWIGMGLRLMATEPVFNSALARCDAAIEAETGWSLFDVLRAGPDESRLDEIDVVQPAIFAMQVALAELLASWGIRPDVVVGHSLGEAAAAYTAGILSLDDAAAIICRRSRLMQRVAGRGGMGVVDLSFAEATVLAARFGDRLAVAASNGPSTTVLSGDPDALDEALAAVQAGGGFARRVQVDVASHSPQVEPLLDDLRQILSDISPMIANTGFASSVTGDYLEGPELGADYWARNLRQPVLFGQVLDKLLNEGDAAFLEISPHPVLLTAIESAIQASNSTSIAVGSLRRGQDEAETIREAIGALWIAGLPVEWHQLAPGLVTLPLPGYPWQRERYWIDTPRRNHTFNGLAQASETSGQWLGSLLPTIATLPGRRFWQGRIEPFEDAPPDDRAGLSVLPATAAMVMAGAACGGPVEQLTVVNQTLLTATVETQTTLGPASEQSEVQIYTRPAGTDEWSLWVTARGAASGPVPDVADLAILMAGLTVQAVPDDRVEELWTSDAASLVRLHSPVHDEQSISSALDLVLRLTVDEPGVVLASIEHVDVRNAIGHGVWVYAFREEQTGALDAYMLALDGSIVGHVRRARFEAPSEELLEQASIERLNDWLYTYSWQPVDAPDHEPVPAGDWLVLASDDTASCAIAAAIEARGSRADTLAVAGVSLETRVNQIQHAIIAGERAYAGILDARTLGRNPDALELASECVAQSALDVAQAVASVRSETLPRLWFVTRGAQPVDGVPQDPAAAGVWGFGRVVANEHPEFWGGLIDLSPDAEEHEFGLLVDAIFSAGDEGEIAIRGTQRYVARLTRADPGDPATLELRDDATYLITGGAGAIGQAIARRMVAAGARYLTLVGRGELRPDAVSCINELEHSGAAIRYIRGDIGCRHDVTTIFEAIAGDMPPLRGIVHAAGVLSDATLLQQSPDSIHTVFAPKVSGASHLVEAARGHELDFLALFSSVSALLGIPGQSNYAAANAVLDAYAHTLQSEGIPAISIGWGRWGEIGLATQAESAAGLDRLGIAPMLPAAGVAAFERVMTSGATHIAVFDIDWPTYLERDRVVRWRFSEITTLGEMDRPQPEGGLRVRLDVVDADGREEVLLDYIRTVVAAVLRFDGPQRVLPTGGFFQIGMDSLTAVELKNQLQQSLDVTLPATIAFDYPTPQTLAFRLHELLYSARDSDVVAHDMNDDLNGLDGVSRDELHDLLEAELDLLNEELAR